MIFRIAVAAVASAFALGVSFAFGLGLPIQSAAQDSAQATHLTGWLVMALADFQVVKIGVAEALSARPGTLGQPKPKAHGRLTAGHGRPANA